MPEQNRPPGYRVRDRPYSLGQAADDGKVIIVNCTGCRKLFHFLASDLVEVLGDPNRPAYDPPFKCSKCGTAAYKRMDKRPPHLGGPASEAIEGQVDEADD